MNGSQESITIDQVIASAKADLGMMDTSVYDVLLEKWINEGVRQTGTSDIFIKKPIVLTIYDHKAKLPKGYRQFIALRYFKDSALHNDDGSLITSKQCLPIVYLDHNFLSECGCHADQWGANYLPSFEIIGDELVFHNHPEDGTKVQFTYLGSNIDDDCLWIIHPDYERGLSAYARWKFLQAYPEYKGQFTPLLLNLAGSEWRAQKKWLKGLASLKDFKNNKYQIHRLVKAWFVNQNNTTNG